MTPIGYHIYICLIPIGMRVWRYGLSRHVDGGSNTYVSPILTNLR
jgi:hypothetical protein